MTEESEVITGADVRRQLGNKLIAAREALGLTPGDVGAQLKILTSAIVGLEAGDYRVIKSQIFIKGYLKAYVKLLGLDLAEFMSLYEATVTPEPDTPSVKPIQSMGPQRRPKYLLYIIIAIITFIVVAIMVSNYGASTSDKSSDKTQVEPLNDDTTDTYSVELPADDFSNMDEESSENVVETAEIAASEALQQSENEAADSAEGFNLRLVFSGECWIEVSDGDGTRLLADLKRGGEVVNLAGQPPFKLLIGNTASIAVFYEGEPVSFKVDANRPKLTLTVGDRV